MCQVSGAGSTKIEHGFLDIGQSSLALYGAEKNLFSSKEDMVGVAASFRYALFNITEPNGKLSVWYFKLYVSGLSVWFCMNRLQ